MSESQKPKKERLSIFKKLYRWVESWAKKPHAEAALAFFSFSESSWFPIPPDPLLMSMVALHHKKWVRFATITVVASVLGGVFGYFIGFGLFETIGEAVLSHFDLVEEYRELGAAFERNALLAIFTAGLTPVPYKLLTITSGAFRINFFLFIFASILSRGLRFYLEAWALNHFGKRYKHKVEEFIDYISIGLIILLILAVIVARNFV